MRSALGAFGCAVSLLFSFPAVHAQATAAPDEGEPVQVKPADAKKPAKAPFAPRAAAAPGRAAAPKAKAPQAGAKAAPRKAAPAAPAIDPETQAEIDAIAPRDAGFRTRRGATGEPVLVFTNDDLDRTYHPEDLDRAFGKPGTAPGAAPGAPAADGDGSGAAAPQGAVDREALQREIQRLQQKQRHIQNPYTRPPQRTQAEVEAERGLGKAELIEKTRREIDDLRKKLQEPPAEAPAEAPAAPPAG